MRKINIIAHRGASYYAQENTMHSFKKALLFPIDMIELDVRVTSDGKPIVFHNNILTYNPLIWIKTKSIGSIDNFTFSDLEHKFANKNIPTLDETICFLRDKMKVNLHIKTLEAVKPTFKILKQYNFEENILISSFRKEILKEIRTQNSKIPLAFLCWVARTNILKFAEKFKINYIHPYYLFLTRKQAAKIKNLGFGLNIWTVNSKHAATRMLDLDVDGIITDKPNLISNF